MVINTCALYGTPGYANSWIGVNLLVVLVSLAIVAVVYSVGRFLPDRTRGRITEATKSEITQALISLIIIAVLIGSAQVACTTSASVGSRMLSSIPGVSASQASLDPFQYADTYIGNLAMHTGLNLLTTIYATDIGYSIEGAIYASVGALFSPDTDALTGTFSVSTLLRIEVGPSEGVDFGNVLRILSDTYLGIFATTTTLIVGALFLQYLLLPVLQYSAFTVLLPVALAMRSLSFTGSGLRNTSNAVIAIAIAAYIIYPLMVLFDSYVMYWVFSPTCPPLATPCNPSLVYLNVAYSSETLPLNSFFSQPIQTPEGDLQTSVKLISSSLTSIGGLKTMFDPFAVVSQIEQIVNQMAELAFQGIVLFAINAAVTIGFAMGLTKALNAGIEGAGSFWSNL